MACCLAITLNSTYAQSNNNKNSNFLRDYKAPDFKQKRFDIGLRLNGGGGSFASSTVGRFQENSDFRFLQFSNSANYQGNLSASLFTDIRFSKASANDVEFKSFSMNYSAGLNTNNRFFFKNEWFIGLHNRGVVSYGSATESDVSNSSLNLSMIPAMSIGNGRMEPVSYARTAMDIEKSLAKGNRLGVEYDEGQLKTIADELAQINNVRFYDFRLRRIEQFEALDRLMREVGGVSDFDMAYFSYLSDAYLYAQSFTRFSGFRSEIGIANRTQLIFQNPGDELYQTYNLMAYANVIYDLPKSYAVQHTFEAGVISGMQFDEDNGIATSTFPTWVTGDYRLGLFPTTRTNLNLGVRGGVVYDQKIEATSSLYANGSIYLSPQFRLSFNASARLGGQYDSHAFGYLIPSPVNSFKGFSFSGGLSLNYAIF